MEAIVSPESWQQAALLIGQGEERVSEFKQPPSVRQADRGSKGWRWGSGVLSPEPIFNPRGQIRDFSGAGEGDPGPWRWDHSLIPHGLRGVPTRPLGGPPEPEASSEVCGPARWPSRTAASPAGSDSAHAAPATRPNAKPFLLAAAEEPPATLASAAPASLTSQHPGRACPSQALRVERPRVRQERVHASGLAGGSSRPLCPVGLSASAAHGHLLPQRQDDASRVPPARDRSPGV